VRTASRIDHNQPEIVRVLRQLGARVQVLSMVGHGVPDLLILHRGKLALVELKDGSKSASRRKLTPDEQLWHEEWADAPLYVVATVDEAVDMLDRMSDE
jgi:soluble P-type ATPase